MSLGNYKLHASSVPEDDEEEEDLVDPIDTLKDECREKNDCVKYNDMLRECADRIAANPETTESCHEEMIDFVHCVDTCVSKTLFSKLK